VLQDSCYRLLSKIRVTKVTDLSFTTDLFSERRLQWKRELPRLFRLAFSYFLESLPSAFFIYFHQLGTISIIDKCIATWSFLLLNRFLYARWKQDVLLHGDVRPVRRLAVHPSITFMMMTVSVHFLVDG
jgi:hypothetical protein